MELRINRTHTTRLYTLGELSINDLRTSHTVEDTLSMLEADTYRVKLVGGVSRRRRIGIIPNSYHAGGLQFFEAGGTHITCRKGHTIGIGEPLIPGALKKGREVFDRLFDRIEKAEARGEEITLIVTDNGITSGEPIKYWLESAAHGCPPTKRRVELHDDQSVSIFEGKKLIKHLTVEEQKALIHKI